MLVRLRKIIVEYFLRDSICRTACDEFEDQYQTIRNKKGYLISGLWFVFQIFCLIPSSLKDTIYWSSAMFKNYLKIAARNFIKNKLYSFINVFGLAIGITFSILVFLFVKNEYSFDRFHPRFEKIFRILNQSTNGNKSETGAFTPMRLAEDLTGLYPEVEEAIRISKTRTIVSSHQAAFREQLFFLEKNFFNVFAFPILQGNRTTPLADINSVVITKKVAEKYFGDENPIGKSLKVEFYNVTQDFKVTAVIDNKSSQSSLVFDLAVSFDFYKARYGGKFMMTNYNASGGETFVLLKHNVRSENFNKKLAQIGTHINLGLRQGRTRKFHLQPLKEIHFNGSQYFTLTKVSQPLYSYIL